MNENLNPPPSLDEHSDTQEHKKVVQPKNRLSKTPLLFSLLSLVCVFYLGYQGIYGQYGVKKLQQINTIQNNRIADLAAQNVALSQQISQLKTSQLALESGISLINPNQSELILNQVNSLVGGANQSLLLYHDYPSAIKLLNYAKSLITSTNDPLFIGLKISLAKDLDNLQAQETFDGTMLASQLENVIQSLPNLKVTEVMDNNSIITPENSSVWSRFIQNIKLSLTGLVKVVKTNQNATAMLIPENELMIRQHLQLNLLNARQALATHNQELWTSSLQDVANVLHNYFILDLITQKDLSIVAQLRQTSFNLNQANLDATMQDLIKTEQLMDRK